MPSILAYLLSWPCSTRSYYTRAELLSVAFKINFDRKVIQSISLVTNNFFLLSGFPPRIAIEFQMSKTCSFGWQLPEGEFCGITFLLKIPPLPKIHPGQNCSQIFGNFPSWNLLFIYLIYWFLFDFYLPILQVWADYNIKM